jgi:hypothetical protein
MGAGVSTDRVFAIVASLASGKVQIGSGYLVTPNRILTARHCLIDSTSGLPAKSVRVRRLSDGAVFQSSPKRDSRAFDLAVLGVSVERREDLEPIQYCRTDRTKSGELTNCEAIGFPRWQYDSINKTISSTEIHGVIRVTEDKGIGFFVLRDPTLSGVRLEKQNDATSEWGGLSGSLVFVDGKALGVVVEHHPRQGQTAMRVLPFSRIARVVEDDADENLEILAALIDLPPLVDFQRVTARHEHVWRPDYSHVQQTTEDFRTWLQSKVRSLRENTKPYGHVETWQDIRHALLQWTDSPEQREYPALNLLGLSSTSGLYLDDVKVSRIISENLVITGYCSMENAHVTGGANFEGARFEAVATFAGTHFGYADFRDATFYAAADFAGADFGNASFLNATFRSSATFSRTYGQSPGAATFDGVCDLMNTLFEGDTDVNECVFRGPLDAENMQLIRSLDATDAHFFDDARFANVTAIGNLVLDGSHCLGILDLTNASGNSVQYEGLMTRGDSYTLGLDSVTEDLAMPRPPNRSGSRSGCDFVDCDFRAVLD